MPAPTPAAPAVLRIAMNGVTGRMGYRQHLLRSILPLRDAGGIQLGDGSRVAVEPILVGRNQAKITELAERHKIEHWSTDLDAVIADPTVDVIFDASMTSLRAATLRQAMAAGKHIFTEKPTAETLADAVELARLGSRCHERNACCNDDEGRTTHDRTNQVHTTSLLGTPDSYTRWVGTSTTRTAESPPRGQPNDLKLV